MEQEYSNREIDNFFKRIDEKLDLIHQQTVKTNGRVSTLEGKVESLEITRAENKGIWKTAGIVAGSVSTAIYFVLNKFT